jgi:rsbT antagonist protein RsbS
MKIPILQLGDILLTSVQIDLTDQAALNFQHELLARVQSTNATGVVMDVTALEVVDSYLARVFNDTAQMVRLMGARVVLCGIRPAVALTLVEMGRELLGVETALNLDAGLAMLRDAVTDPLLDLPPDLLGDGDA